MEVLDGVAADDVNPNQQRVVVPDGSENNNSVKCLFTDDYALVFLLLFYAFLRSLALACFTTLGWYSTHVDH